jgi:hypothetical protein
MLWCGCRLVTMQVCMNMLAAQVLTVPACDPPAPVGVSTVCSVLTILAT